MDLRFLLLEAPLYLSYTDLSPVDSLSGDSGSAIFGVLPGTTRPLITATHSGRSRSSRQYDDTFMLRVRVANDDVRNFLTSQIPSNDTDSDGIIDALDNCVQTPNPDQADADLDGRGDLCDNCSPLDPLRCANPALCSNPQQADGDGDGIGDLCDPFPRCGANTALACAGCADPADVCKLLGSGTGCPAPAQTLACTSVAGCPPTNNPAQVQQCLTDGGPGRCAFLGDSDDADGTLDLCDQCPGFKNNLAVAGTATVNSNPEAELVTGQSALANGCDPVPLGVPDIVGDPPKQEYEGGILKGPPDAQIETERSTVVFSTKSFLGKITRHRRPHHPPRLPHLPRLPVRPDCWARQMRLARRVLPNCKPDWHDRALVHHHGAERERNDSAAEHHRDLQKHCPWPRACLDLALEG